MICSLSNVLLTVTQHGTIWQKLSKGIGHPRTGHEGPEGEQTYSATLPSTSALDGGGWWTPRPRPIYPPVKTRTHCIGGWVGPRAGLDGCGKSRPPPPGFDPRTVQPVASRYTDWAIAAHINKADNKANILCTRKGERRKNGREKQEKRGGLDSTNCLALCFIPNLVHQ